MSVERTNDVSKACRSVKEDNSTLRLTDASEFYSECGVVGACAKCGSVLFVPPTILDHSEYAPGLYKGASFCRGWRDQMKFV